MTATMADRVCLITGATSGIGRVTAAALAGMGATVVLVARDPGRGQRTKEEIMADSGNPALHVLVADLSSQAQIRKLADAYRELFEHLHVLVNNAGLIVSERRLTEDGVEETFAVNHLAPFLITNLLRDLLERSAPARVVTTASRAHAVGTMNFDDLQGERRYRSQGAYSQSKLANVMFTYELARRLQGSAVTANCVHPGVVNTNFGATGTPAFKAFIRLFRRFMRTPEQGADTLTWAASSPDVEGVTGRYFVKRRAARSSKKSHDQEAAGRLWRISEQLTGLSG